MDCNRGDRGADKILEMRGVSRPRRKLVRLTLIIALAVYILIILVRLYPSGQMNLYAETVVRVHCRQCVLSVSAPKCRCPATPCLVFALVLNFLGYIS
jgi:hypothetical protein